MNEYLKNQKKIKIFIEKYNKFKNLKKNKYKLKGYFLDFKNNEYRILKFFNKEINYFIKNIIIEHSLGHFDNLYIFNNKINKFNDFLLNFYKKKTLFIIESLNKLFIPILIKNFTDIFKLKMNINYYYIINDNKDLKKLNFLKQYIFDNYNYSKYNENFYLLKIESIYYKYEKKFLVFSLYGYNNEISKFKFLFFFELFYNEYNFFYYNNIFFDKINEYYISFVYIKSVYNKYYWLNLFNLLNDDDDNINKIIKLKDSKTLFYENWLNNQNKLFGLDKLLKKKEDIQKFYEFIITEKQLKITEWILQKELELKKDLLIIQDKINEELILKKNPQLKRKKENEDIYIYFINIIPKLENWKKWNNLHINEQKFKEIKFNIFLFFNKFNIDGTLKK